MNLTSFLKHIIDVMDSPDTETQIVELTTRFSEFLTTLKQNPMKLSVMVDDTRLVESFAQSEIWNIWVSDNEKLWNKFMRPLASTAKIRMNSSDITPLALQKKIDALLPLIRDVASVCEEESITFEVRVGNDRLVKMGLNTTKNLKASMGATELHIPSLAKLLRIVFIR